MISKQTNNRLILGLQGLFITATLSIASATYATILSPDFNVLLKRSIDAVEKNPKHKHLTLPQALQFLAKKLVHYNATNK